MSPLLIAALILLPGITRKVGTKEWNAMTRPAKPKRDVGPDWIEDMLERYADSLPKTYAQLDAFKRKLKEKLKLKLN